MRKPLTEQSRQLVLAELQTLAPGRVDVQREILDQSIRNGWSGVFPLKKGKPPERPASYDVEAFERELLYGEIVYKKPTHTG